MKLNNDQRKLYYGYQLSSAIVELVELGVTTDDIRAYVESSITRAVIAKHATTVQCDNCKVIYDITTPVCPNCGGKQP